MYRSGILASVIALASCVAIPTNNPNHEAKCEISSDRLTLRVIDVAKETNSYYSVSGLMLTPIILPTSAMISGVYVAVNNIYNSGEERLVCKS